MEYLTEALFAFPRGLMTSSNTLISPNISDLKLTTILSPFLILYLYSAFGTLTLNLIFMLREIERNWTKTGQDAFLVRAPTSEIKKTKQVKKRKGWNREVFI
jgi:hypothetical protein